MFNRYEVINTEMDDLEMIFEFFKHSITYQEKHGYPSWKNYDRNAIIHDTENRNQYKIVLSAKMAIVFSVCYSDKVIWRELDQGDSMYLHRIVVNPLFKGQKLFGNIMEWAVEHCRKRRLQNIRMDTWAANPTIINYYQGFGFTVIKNYITPDSTELPVHNRNLALTLLERKIKYDYNP